MFKKKEKRYYYSTPCASPLGEKLAKMLSEIARCEQAAEKLAASVGASSYIPSTVAAYGGIAAFGFDNIHMQDERFKSITTEDKEVLFVPNEKTKAGSKLRNKVNSLPVIPANVLLDMFGLEKNITYTLFRVEDNYFVALPQKMKGEQLEHLTVISETVFKEAHADYKSMIEQMRNQTTDSLKN